MYLSISNRRGFTFIEITVALAVIGFIIAGLYVSYRANIRSYTAEEAIAEMQNNARYAMTQLVRELRMAGYDPSESGAFGFTTLTYDGNNSIIEFTADFEENGNATDADNYRHYEIKDLEPSGIPDLAKIQGGSTSNVAEGIEKMFLAFAFDNDGDGLADRNGANETIWGYSDDSDTDLEKSISYDANGTAVIQSIGPIPCDKILAARIWLLATTKIAIPEFDNSRVFNVGPQTISITDDHPRYLQETVVKLRNINPSR